MSTRFRLIELLADGEFRSGQWLGQQLGISRAAVWKQIKILSDLGLDVHAVRGRGYQLAVPFQPLRENLIRAPISPSVNCRLDTLEIFREIDSTSDHLKRALAGNRAGNCRACVAEWQSSGRGRRGRRWVSPYGTSLYLSMSIGIDTARLYGGLSLVAAIAVLGALQSCGIEGLGLKWPNDIYFRERKLAGILLDISGESGGPYHVVIGIGINLNVPDIAAREIDQPWADLSQSGADVDRNRLAGLVLEAMVRAIDRFGEKGLDAFRQEWKRFDLVADRPVVLRHGDDTTVTGVARGIDAQGALLIEQNGITNSYHAGEVSLRFA